MGDNDERSSWEKNIDQFPTQHLYSDRKVPRIALVTHRWVCDALIVAETRADGVVDSRTATENVAKM